MQWVLKQNPLIETIVLTPCLLFASGLCILQSILVLPPCDGSRVGIYSLVVLQVSSHNDISQVVSQGMSMFDSATSTVVLQRHKQMVQSSRILRLFMQ
jgi:hypothetical protein